MKSLNTRDGINSEPSYLVIEAKNAARYDSSLVLRDK
jgi:hypothetical protein